MKVCSLCFVWQETLLDLEALTPMCVWQEIILKSAEIALVKQKPSGLEHSRNNDFITPRSHRVLT